MTFEPGPGWIRINRCTWELAEGLDLVKGISETIVSLRTRLGLVIEAGRSRQEEYCSACLSALVKLRHDSLYAMTVWLCFFVVALWALSRRIRNKLMHALNGNMYPVNPNLIIMPGVDVGHQNKDLIIYSTPHLGKLRNYVVRRAHWRPKIVVNEVSMSFDDVTFYKVLIDQFGRTPRDRMLVGKLHSLAKAVHLYLSSPSPSSYLTLCNSIPFPNLIQKARLYPTQDLNVRVWSLYCSLVLMARPTLTATTLDGSTCVLEGKALCWEGYFSKTKATAMDFMKEGTGVQVLCDSTSGRSTSYLWEKIYKLTTQAATYASSPSMTALVVHTPWSGPTFELVCTRKTEDILKCERLGVLFREKPKAWKKAMARVVDDTMVKLMRASQFVVPEFTISPDVKERARELYLGGLLKDKIDFINSLDDDYSNGTTLANCVTSIRTGGIKPAVKYASAIGFQDLEESKPILSDLLKSSQDPIVAIMMGARNTAGPYWLMSDGNKMVANRRFLECETDQIPFPAGSVALIEDMTEEGSEIIQTRIAVNPSSSLASSEGGFFQTVVESKAARANKVEHPRESTWKDLFDATESVRNSIVELSKQWPSRNTTHIGYRKKWIADLSPPCLNTTYHSVINRLYDIELGGALNHQFEICSAIQYSLMNSKKHRFALVRNGHTYSYSLIKCSAGAGVFHICPARVIYLSTSSMATRYDKSVVKVEDGVYLRTSRWHGLDSRALQWGINQPLVVESRIANIVALEPDMIVTDQDIVLTSMPTFPNTQDFSKLSGPLKNVVDGLESVESDPKGITNKFSDYTANCDVELWFTIDYLTTHLIGRLLHKAHDFELGGRLRDPGLGCIHFKFPDLPRSSSHPEVLNNFKNPHHLLVKVKSNKIGPEARDFISIWTEKQIYDTKMQERLQQKRYNFGTSWEDWENLQSEELDVEQVERSLTEAWAVAGKGKKHSRYQWNIWYQLRAVDYDQQQTRVVSTPDEDYWRDAFSTSLEEYLQSTGSMEHSSIDLSRRQSRRKSTSVYELLVMVSNNSTARKLDLRGAVADMVQKRALSMLSLGQVIVFLVLHGGDPALIRILDKDQVEGEREISALDVMSMMLCSLHEKSWTRHVKVHPVDAIQSKDKSIRLNHMIAEAKKVIGERRDLTMVFHYRDCNRYGPNQDMEQLAINAAIYFTGVEKDIMLLACQSLLNKICKPPESIALLYTQAMEAPEGVTVRDGLINQVFQIIKNDCNSSGGLVNRGGMQQGITSIGASANTSLGVQYTNYLQRCASSRVIASFSAQTSDDGADVHVVHKTKVYDTLRWMSLTKNKSLSMNNNILNPTKSGISFHVIDLNQIRKHKTASNDIIETTQMFKMINTKVALPDSMSFVEDCIKANLYGADLLKLGVPADLVMFSVVHSLLLCYHLHKKWIYISEEKYTSIPSILGGPIGACFVETVVTPLAPLLVYNGGLFDLSTPDDLTVLSKSILRMQLLEGEGYQEIDSDFGDRPSLYKKTAEGMRFTRRPTKDQRKAFRELFLKGYTTGGVPNCIYPRAPSSYRDATESFLTKLTAGTPPLDNPSNKYPITWGHYRKSYSKECLVLTPYSPLHLLLEGVHTLGSNGPKVKYTPEKVKALLLEASPELMLRAIWASADVNYANSMGSKNGLGHTEIYSAMLDLMIAKFTLVAEVTTALTHLHHSSHAMAYRERVTKLVPMVNTVVRSKKDIQGLEQEVKKKIFVNYSGQAGIDYLYDEFCVHYNSMTPVNQDPLPLARSMLLAEQYSAVVLEFMTLKDKKVQLRAKSNVTDEKSLMSQLLRYNMSYNIEYILDDAPFLRIHAPPLKRFIENIWVCDTEERAIEQNNRLALSNLINLPDDRETLYLSTDELVRGRNGLRNCTVATGKSDMSRAVIDVPDTSYQSEVMQALALGLNAEVLYTSESMMGMMSKIASKTEVTAGSGLWVDSGSRRLVQGDEVPVMTVSQHVAGNYTTADLVDAELIGTKDLLDEKNQYNEPRHAITLPRRMQQSLSYWAGLICTHIEGMKIPLSRLKVIDFDWAALGQGVLFQAIGGLVTGQEVVESQDTGDHSPSLTWCANGLTIPHDLAYGYIGTYGTNKMAERKLKDYLVTGSCINDEVYYMDRSFAATFAQSVDWRDARLSPYTRICVLTISEHLRRPQVEVRLNSSFRGLLNKAPPTRAELADLDRSASSRLVVRQDTVDSDDSEPEAVNKQTKTDAEIMEEYEANMWDDEGEEALASLGLSADKVMQVVGGRDREVQGNFE